MIMQDLIFATTAILLLTGIGSCISVACAEMAWRLCEYLEFRQLKRWAESMQSTFSSTEYALAGFSDATTSSGESFDDFCIACDELKVQLSCNSEQLDAACDNLVRTVRSIGLEVNK